MKRFLWITVPIVLMVLVFYLFFRPVCVIITEEEVKNFNPPIETRTDKNFYMQTFQKKNGQWYQCKTWISRKFFF
ncbi:MAG TPA: hypothetical protein VLB82_01180 [Thermodesulfobacteriota bacterium]|nr:hypothetical protein [Thermodesulfobacteriota bacterium]